MASKLQTKIFIKGDITLKRNSEMMWKYMVWGGFILSIVIGAKMGQMIAVESLTKRLMSNQEAYSATNDVLTNATIFALMAILGNTLVLLALIKSTLTKQKLVTITVLVLATGLGFLVGFKKNTIFIEEESKTLIAMKNIVAGAFSAIMTGGFSAFIILFFRHGNNDKEKYANDKEYSAENNGES
ncbi:hypothetical protein IKG29_01605 [Candidatus Saccharibacteria bacterium]|nr:hypothetical protein [Candidatus Saccharibacteria bacterium]